MTKRFFLASLVALLAPVSLWAQAASPTAPVTLDAPPTYLGTYDLASQTLLPGPPPPGSTVVFDNTTGNGSLFPSGAGTVDMDWGTLSAGGANDIDAIQIGYATSTAAPSTVDMIVYLHEGATGFGDIGTTITGFNITGLPGSTLGPGVFEGFVVDVVLPGTVNLPDGAIGWSYELLDDNTGPLTIGPPNEAGVIDAFDQYTAGFGGYLGTFFFGGAPFASFHMQLSAATECFLVIGDAPGAGLFNPGIHAWETQVGQVQDFHPVLLDDMPDFALPLSERGVSAVGGTTTSGGLTTVQLTDWMADGEFTVQVVMWNPGVFPNLPEQYTHGLQVKVLPNGQVRTRPFGEGTGMEVWAETDVDAQGNPVVRFPFSIPGM